MHQLILARFPALPASISDLLRLAPSDPQYYEKVLDVCSSDPGLASEVMRMAHGVGVCPTVRIRSVREALLHVGPKPVIAHFLGGMMLRVFAPYDHVMRDLWVRCVRTAAACARLAKDQPGPLRDPHEARTVGLLHNLGQVALACVDRERYSGLLERSHGDTSTLMGLERATYGADHAEMGAQLAKDWGFNDTLIYVMRHHHDATLTGGPEGSIPLCRLVAFADALVELDVDSAAKVSHAVRLAHAAGLPVEAGDLPTLSAAMQREASFDVERLGLFEHAGVG